MLINKNIVIAIFLAILNCFLIYSGRGIIDLIAWILAVLIYCLCMWLFK